MASCPACRREVPAGSVECPGCGIVIAKYRPRPQPASASPTPPRSATAGPPTSTGSPTARLGLVLLLGLAGGGAVASGYWYFEIRPRLLRIEDPQRLAAASSAGRVKVRVDPVAELDRSVELPGSPGGLAADDQGLVIVNRNDPWGFLRLRPDGAERFTVEKQPVIEPTYAQNVQLWAVAWNGSRFVGYTDGDWFGRPGEGVFTLHDPQDLRVIQTFEAPLRLGCLEWDGDGYWAATRRNTRDADEPAHLYRFDADFRLLASHEPPGLGCQGMAWDGRYLWFADVFDDRLYVLEIVGGRPRVRHAQPIRLRYPSGLVHFDGDLWLSEYGENRLYRLNPRFRTAWTSATPPPARARTRPERTPQAATRLERETIARLRRQLRSPDRHRRDAAEMELRRAGVPVDYDRYEDPFAPERIGEEEIAIDHWEIELRDGTLYGGWSLRFGEGLFESDRRIELFGPVSLPIFAQYRVSVEGGTLAQERELTFDAQPGENRKRGVKLATDLGHGRYTANLFVHVQYVTSQGTGQILNQSSFQLEVEQ